MASATIEDKGNGRWRVRWREKVEGAWKSREVTVHGSRHDADEMRLRVIRALEDHGRYDASAEKKAHAGPANLLAGLLDYVTAMGLRDEKRERLRVLRVVKAIHAHTGIPEDRPIPVTVLSRPLFHALRDTWEGTAPRKNLGMLWRAWGWMADDPATYPHVPPCPRNPAGYVPKGTVYGRTVAPELAHADAALRRLRARVEGHGRGKADTIVCALIMRYTGLRVGQVRAIERRDLDVVNGTLIVRHAKSDREQADMRILPLSRHLLAEPAIVAWLARLPSEGRIVQVSDVLKSVRASWQDATREDKVPEYVWNPPNRRNARPDHAFRAALQAHMEDAGIKSDVVDFLVGHASGSVRETHYGRDLLRAARAAVDALPPVDWTGPQAEGSNVVPMRKAT